MELLSYDFNDFIKRKIKETIDELLEGEIEALFNEGFRTTNSDFHNGYYRHLKPHYELIMAINLYFLFQNIEDV